MYLSVKPVYFKIVIIDTFRNVTLDLVVVLLTHTQTCLKNNTIGQQRCSQNAESPASPLPLKSSTDIMIALDI